MSAGAFSSLKVADWPEIDRRLWRTAREVGDELLDRVGPAADWRPKTIVNVEYFWGTFLWWLAQTGRLDPMGSPRARVTREVILAFIEAYEVGHARSSVAAMLRVIHDFVSVTCTDVDLEWLRTLARAQQRSASPIKKTGDRRRPVAELVAIASHYLSQAAEIRDVDPRRAAEMFRDGLIFACETAIPLRRENLATLRLGHTLRKAGNRYVVTHDGSSMKNRRDFERTYPEFLTPPIDEWLSIYRPLLLTPGATDEGWMWIGVRCGRRLDGPAISKIVRRINEIVSGSTMTLHGFRHSVASDIIAHMPGRVAIIKTVLGHASPLSHQHYDLAAAFEIQDRWHGVLDDLRRRDRNSGSTTEGHSGTGTFPAHRRPTRRTDP